MRLKRKIEQFSRLCGAKSFSPHVTIYSGITTKPSSDTLQLLANRHKAPTLSVLGTRHSSKYFQCISLALHRNKALTALRKDSLQSLGAAYTTAPFLPHISLLYGNFGAAQRMRLAKQISADLLTHCQGSELQLVLTDGPQSQWQVLEQHTLREQQ